MVAHQTFNLDGVGSSPTWPTKQGEEMIKVKKKSNTVIILEKLVETFDWYVKPDNIPSRKKLYYEAQRIEKALNGRKL